MWEWNLEGGGVVEVKMIMGDDAKGLLAAGVGRLFGFAALHGAWKLLLQPEGEKRGGCAG